MKHVLGNRKAIALFVVPALIIYSIIVMLPVIWSLYYSFFNPRNSFTEFSSNKPFSLIDFARFNTMSWL